jgi:REP element-mobilizing transposase RayT
MIKYRNKYRIESSRYKNWDYSSNGYYFITICTKNRGKYFGQIVKGEMQLSEIGKCTEKCWGEIPTHFPFVKLDSFVVMPDHIHGILIIDKKKSIEIVGGGNGVGCKNIVGVETQDFASLRGERGERGKPKSRYGPQSKNIPSIIRGFKIGVTIFSKKNNFLFGWQPRYHDHVIRGNDELWRIRKYIKNNPIKFDQSYNTKSCDNIFGYCYIRRYIDDVGGVMTSVG